MVVVFVVPVVFWSKRGIFLLRLGFYVLSLRLLWRRSWKKKTKVVVVVLGFWFKIGQRGRWWNNLQRRGNAKTFE